MDNLDDLKYLDPDQRIKKLRELEEKRKKEIEIAQKKINESKEDINAAKREIHESEKELEEVVDTKRRIPIEQLKSVGMDNLDSGEEKDLFKIKRFKAQKQVSEDYQQEENLEQITNIDIPISQIETNQYVLDLSQKPTQDIYNQTREMYDNLANGEVTKDQFYQAMDISYALREKEEAINIGKYTATEKLERETNAIKNMVDEIIKWYSG